MEWIVGGIIGIFVLVAIWKFLGWQPLGRNRGREDFEHGIKSLLILKENGGSLHVQQRGSDMAFDFVRAEGRANDTLLLLRIPRALWSEQHCKELSDAFSSHQFEAQLVGNDSQTLAEVRIPVQDIWEEWCGARGARAAHLLLDTIGVPRDARFDLSLHGNPSRRGLARERQLRQQDRSE